MPRVSRKASSIQTYHVILRGIDKRNIFLSTDDYEKFLFYILKAKGKCDFSMYAFCLMTNHVHILIRSEGAAIGDIIKRITVGYVQYHNNKYARTGHLFQNRFKSEPVEDTRYFLTVLRYIHQNPIKSGITKNISDYPWSSYHAYIKNNALDMIDTGVAMESFPSIQRFKEFMNTECEDSCLEYNVKNKYTDEELYLLINEYLDISKLEVIDINSRNIEIKKIKDQTKASNRQLSRVLGIGRGILSRVK
jgi:REP element-mobilizing transposase RayT